MVESRVDVVRVAAWDRWRWLRHGFSTRRGGSSPSYGEESLNLGFTQEDDAIYVEENRRRFLHAAGVDQALATVRQVHGASVIRIEHAGPAGDADGMITDRAGLSLGILVADCVPILVADTRLRAVGAFHAGWRGTAAGIASAGIQAMREEFGSRSEDLVAAIGPSIGRCCYKVGDELLEQFSADLFQPGRKLDLWEANRRQLAAAGVPSVSVIAECTQCSILDGRQKYFSYRGDKGVTGRSMGVIGMV